MSKYSSKFKLYVVREYLQGQLSAKTLAKKYHIPSEEDLKSWIQACQLNGAAGFEKKTKEKRFY